MKKYKLNDVDIDVPFHLLKFECITIEKFSNLNNQGHSCTKMVIRKDGSKYKFLLIYLAT